MNVDDLFPGEPRENDGESWDQVARALKPWIREYLRYLLTASNSKNLDQLPIEEELEALLEYYCAVPSCYLEWSPTDPDRGTGFWTLNLETTTEEISQQRMEIRHQRGRLRDEKRVKSLDEWLREDREGTLEYPGAQGGRAAVPVELRASLTEMASRRKARWPR